MGGNLHRRDRTELNRFLDPLDRFWSASRAAPEIQGDPAGSCVDRVLDRNLDRVVDRRQIDHSDPH